MYVNTGIKNGDHLRGYRIYNIIDILEQHEYSMGEICHSPIDFEECIYSGGFVSALEKGLKPCINRVHENTDRKFSDKEWHHFETDGKLMCMYFEEVEDETE